MTVLNHTPRNISAAPIGLVEAAQEPIEDRLFADAPPAPPYPALTITTTVIDPDGFTWSVTFNDTPLAAAAAILQKRGCRPAGATSPSSAPATNGSAPMCPVHQKPMKPMTRPDRQRRTFWCTSKTDDGFCQERA